MFAKAFAHVCHTCWHVYRTRTTRLPPASARLRRAAGTLPPSTDPFATPAGTIAHTLRRVCHRLAPRPRRASARPQKAPTGPPRRSDASPRLHRTSPALLPASVVLNETGAAFSPACAAVKETGLRRSRTFAVQTCMGPPHAFPARPHGNTRQPPPNPSRSTNGKRLLHPFR